MILFVLGRAGCGKSTATRYLARRLQVERITDYPLLYAKFLSGDPRFRSATHGSFDIIEDSVCDEVLREVQTKALAYSSTDALITIEFARNDYHRAFQQFELQFLKRAHFLLIDADLETCIRRVHTRVNDEPDQMNNHPTSEHVMRTYFREMDLLKTRTQLAHELAVDPSRIRLVDNNGALQAFLGQIDMAYNLNHR